MIQTRHLFDLTLTVPTIEDSGNAERIAQDRHGGRRQLCRGAAARHGQGLARRRLAALAQRRRAVPGRAP